MRFTGVVQEGKKRGHQLGFPTVNIPLSGENVDGIFAAKVFFEGKEYGAAAYANVSRGILEAHLLDRSDDLYGKEIEIELVKKIRDDRTFADEVELKAAITDDVAKVREYFKN